MSASRPLSILFTIGIIALSVLGAFMVYMVLIFVSA